MMKNRFSKIFSIILTLLMVVTLFTALTTKAHAEGVTYEEPDRISVSDLKKSGKPVGNKIIMDAHNKYTYEKTTKYGSLVFSFVLKNSKWTVDDDGGQFHFFDGWQMDGSFWLRPDHIRIIYKEGETNKYIVGNAISAGTHNVELGRLAIMNGDEYTGNQYFYIKIDDELFCEHTIENFNNSYLNSNTIFMTCTSGNAILDKDWNGSHITYTVNGEVYKEENVFDDYLTKPTTNPTMEGKTFIGWFDKMGKEWDFEHNMAIDNLVLRAGFKGEESVSDETYFSDENYNPVLRFLVASDVHISTNTSIRDSNLANTLDWAYEMAESSPKYKALDATLFAGDISDNGDVLPLNTFNSIVKSKLKGNTQFIVSMGNHDFRMTSPEASISQFANLFGPVDKHLVINGFHFITLSPDLSEGEHFSESKVEWLDEQLSLAQEADPTKPIFVMQHEHIQGTVYGSDAWYVSELTDVLCKYPQVVDFSGHSHYPLSDPRSIWQGTFTALGTGTMHYFEVGINGYKNTGIFPKDKSGGWNPSPHANSAASEFQIVEIDDNNAIRITAYDLASRSIIAQYYIRNAMDDIKFKYSPIERAKSSEAPEFEEGAKLNYTLDKTNVTLKFNQATCKDIVESYRAKIYQGSSLYKTEYILSDYFFHPTPNEIEYTITGLRSETEYRIELYAVNVWGDVSTSHIDATFETEYVDYGEEGYGSYDLINVLDIDVPDNTGILEGIPSENRVFNYPGKSPSYTAVFQYYLITGDLNNKDEFRTQVGKNWEYYISFWIQAGKFDYVFSGWIYSEKPSDRIKYDIKPNSIYKIEYGTIYVDAGEHEGEGLVYCKINDVTVSSYYINFNQFHSDKYNVTMHLSDNFKIADISLGRTIEYYVDDEKVEEDFGISGLKIKEPTAPTKPGLFFVGWYTDPVGGERVDFNKTFTSSEKTVKYYARFTDTTYNLKFYNDNNELIDTQVVGKDCIAIKPTDPVKTGTYKYSFVKWVIKGTQEEFDFNSRVTSNIELEAVFEEYKYRIVYLVDGLEFTTRYFIESNPDVIIGSEPSVPTLMGATGRWVYSDMRENKDIYVRAIYDGVATTPSSDISLNKFNGATVDIADDLTRFYLSFADTNEQSAWIDSYPVSGGHERQNISFSWTDSSRNMSYLVYFADNEAFENAFIVRTDTRYIDYVGIFIPGKTYYWKVVGLSNNKASEVDTFKVLNTPVRWISAGTMFNVRDLGGWTTTDSKVVNYGLIYRGGQLSLDSQSEKSYMDEYAFKVFDYLKMKSEIELRGDMPHKYNQFNEFENLYLVNGNNYMGMFSLNDKAKQNYRDVFTALADSKNYPFYFHCSWGADRTGSLAFLINGVLGVPFEQLVEDYELTSLSNSGTRTRNGWSNGAFMKMYNNFMTNYARGGSLEDAIYNYLIEYIGVKAEEIQSLRSIMLKDATDVLVKHTVTYKIDGEIYQRSTVFDGEYIKEIVPVYFEKHLECWLLDGKPFDSNTKVTTDLVLEARFKETRYEDYDIITVRDLGVGESFVPSAHNYKFEGTASSGGRMFIFDYLITADDGAFNDGVHVEIGPGVWDCRAHIWFSDQNSIHIFIEGLGANGTMHPVATYNRHLDYGKTYKVSIGVIIPIDGEFAGKKMFIVLIDDEILSFIQTSSDLMSSYNIGIAGTEGVLKSVPNKKKVQFFASNGTLIETKEITRGELVTPVDTEGEEGKVFLGWFDELGNLWKFESNKVLKDMKLFAKFGDKTIDAVVLDEFDMEISHGYKVKIGLTVSEIELPLVPSEALEFDAWYNGTTKLNPTDVITEDMDLICRFNVKEVEPVDPVNPVDPVDPVNPVDPVEPTKKGCKSLVSSGLVFTSLALFAGISIINKRKKKEE